MLARPLLAVLTLALLPLSSQAQRIAAAPDDPGLPFQDLAKRSLAAHGHPLESPGTLDLEEFFGAHYLSAELGLYRLGAPAHRLTERRWADAYRNVAASLLDAQLRWLERVDPASERSKEARSDLATLRRWVGRWSAADLAKGSASQQRAVLELLGAKPDVVQASERLRSAMLAGGALAAGPTLEAPVALILAPTRADFVELLALAGWAREELRPLYWQKGVDDWLEFTVDDRKVIALEYVATGRAPGDYAAGSPMDERTTTGLQQQVVQLALLRLVDVYYEGRMPAELGKGLVMNLVVDLFGEIRTRVDGDLRAHQTQGREAFVRGGASEGGRLPQNLAETRWRADGGKDRYLRILRQVQRSGRGTREGSRNELANFQLQSRDESQRAIVSAPVFGSAAAAADPPPAMVEGDWLEFVRAYQCGFVHWLQSHGAGAKKPSEQALARLLAALAEPERTQSVEETFAAIYGAPLSDADCSPGTLEGRFLRWLSTQR